MPKKCDDSPDGKHSFEPDYEYDSTGKTINCEHCGAAKPKHKYGPAATKLLKGYVNIQLDNDGVDALIDALLELQQG